MENQQTVSLAEFLATARNLLNDGNHTAFARFVLTGIWGEHGTQAIVDPIRNTIVHGHPVTVTRDYDSLLALVSDLPLKCTIYIYPVARQEDHLQSNIHLTHPITRQGVSDHSSWYPQPELMDLCISLWHKCLYTKSQTSCSPSGERGT